MASSATTAGIVLLLALALVGAGGACGWAGAWWAHRRTDLSPRVFYVGAAVVLGVTPVVFLLGAGAPLAVVMLWLPLVAAATVAASFAARHRRRALGAGGELRRYELDRRGLRSWWRARDVRREAQERGERTLIATQGELVREQPITFRTVALQADGTMPVAAEQGRHLFICGVTGRGKTRTIERIVGFRVRDHGAGLVVIDPKPDRDLAAFLRALAARCDRPFYLVDPRATTGASYNPLAEKDPSAAAEIALAGLEFSEPYYHAGALLHLDTVARVLHARHGALNVSLLASAAGLQAEAIVRDWARGTDVDERAQRYYDELAAERDRKKAVAGTVLRIQAVAQRRWSDTLGPDASGNALSLLAALRERAIVLIRPVAGEGREEARVVAGMALADLNAACTQLTQDHDHWIAVMDEFSGVVSPPAMEHLIGLYQRARSAGGQLVMATQSVADLAAFTERPELTDSLAENFGSLIAHAQQSQTSREWLSMYMGTTELWQSTDRTANHGVADGTGSTRRAREFRVAPDTFRELGRGEVITYTAPAAPTRGTVTLLPSPPSDAGTPPAGRSLVAAGPRDITLSDTDDHASKSQPPAAAAEQREDTADQPTEASAPATAVGPELDHDGYDKSVL